MKKLESYLNDHLAGSVGAPELIEHSVHEYDGQPLGAFFSNLQTDIRADQDTLRDLMHGLAIDESNVRKAGAWRRKKRGVG
jgi:hypothetical protein